MADVIPDVAAVLDGALRSKLGLRLATAAIVQMIAPQDKVFIASSRPPSRATAFRPATVSLIAVRLETVIPGLVRVGDPS